MRTHHPVTFTFPGDQFLTIENGNLTSNLKSGAPEDAAYDAAIDGMEGILLALACAGVTLDTPSVEEAVQIALEGICNHHA